ELLVPTRYYRSLPSSIGERDPTRPSARQRVSTAVSLAEIVEEDALLRGHAAHSSALDLLHDAIELLAIDDMQVVAADARPAHQTGARRRRRLQLGFEAQTARAEISQPHVHHRGDHPAEVGEMGHAVAPAKAAVQVDA